jgi:pimeloyl-ACP methyl ester carboxylesterase
MDLSLAGKRVTAGSGGRAFDPALPTVLLLHGAGMDHTVFALQARALAHRGRNVLAFDLPGHGQSAGPAIDGIGELADWVLSAASAAGVERFRIAGHSMGALVALETAARAAERVDALALLGFAPEMRVNPELLADARASSHRTIELMTNWSFGARGRLGANPAPGLWLTGAAMRLLERADPESLAIDLAACDAYRGAEAAAPRIRCPVLLLLGAEDRMTPAARGQAFAATVAGSRVVLLPGAGHMMMMEAPAATLRAMREFL